MSADFRGLTWIYKDKSPQIARMTANNDEDTELFALICGPFSAKIRVNPWTPIPMRLSWMRGSMGRIVLPHRKM
jgi:hypothetical protein